MKEKINKIANYLKPAWHLLPAVGLAAMMFFGLLAFVLLKMIAT